MARLIYLALCVFTYFFDNVTAECSVNQENSNNPAAAGDISYYAPGLRVFWGWPNNTAARGKTIFIDIALTINDAELRDGWVQIPLPEGTPYSDKLTMRCPPNDLTFCAFYDDINYIAGFQVAVPINGIVNPVPADLSEVGSRVWLAPAPVGGTAEALWRSQVFIVDEESLNLAAKVRKARITSKNTLLYNNALWVPDTDYTDGRLRMIEDSESAIVKSGYVRQNCFMGMGRHNYYELLTRVTCDRVDPWFPMTASGGGILHGVGYILQAVYPKVPVESGKRTWFEGASGASLLNTLPLGPQCQRDLADALNLRTIHIYFISEPWKIECSDEDYLTY